MKGDPKVLETLNSLLIRELTVVSQYMVHAEVCDNWGYSKLHENIQKRAVQEMKHAETLVARIIFLEGVPSINEREKMHIAADVQKMFANDHLSELEAVERYNSGILVCGEARDFATREVLEKILDDEDKHVDDIEAVLDQMSQMGVPLFLSEQVG